MAALPFEDELNGLVCTICLDLFNEPVTLPCGHSFCCVCIVKYWESSDGPGACVCANCREIFLQKPTLKRSVILDCLVKQVKLKKGEVGFLVRGQDDPKNEEHVTAHRRGGESRCEVCNRESVKRCIPCEIMCCERHVKPHKEKGHRLVEPGDAFRGEGSLQTQGTS
uniref:RING-type domain-containing protein n=1 Tax=Eptatretus burgeri TaxID=7764 RepID=A0A8C4Q598_EPTBU